jgi:hypothetical protein
MSAGGPAAAVEGPLSPRGYCGVVRRFSAASRVWHLKGRTFRCAIAPLYTFVMTSAARHLLFLRPAMMHAPLSPRETTEESPHLRVRVAIKIDSRVPSGTARATALAESNLPVLIDLKPRLALWIKALVGVSVRRDRPVPALVSSRLHVISGNITQVRLTARTELHIWL